MSKRGLRRFLILVVGAGLLVALAAGAVVLRKHARDRALLESRDEGIRLAESGEYAAGLELLSPYVSRYRDDEEALLAYARCRLGLPMPNNKHLAGALNAVRQAEQMNPGSVAPLVFLIDLYAATRQQTELVDACERALAIDPTLETALDGRVYGLLALDRVKEAREAADDFVRAYPDRLRSAIATAAVLDAEGADAEAVDAYLRSDEIAARLGDQVVYHLRIAASAAQAAEQGSEDGFVRAVSSARTAAEMPQRSASVAAETTELLRRLGRRTGDDGLIALAEEVVDRRLAEGSLGDAYSALESRAAWWRLDDARASVLAAAISEATDDESARGWSRFMALHRGVNDISTSVSGLGSPPTAEQSNERTFWSSLVEARSVAASGGSPSAVDAASADAARLAPGLDAQNPGTYHGALVMYVRSTVLAVNGQGDSSLALLDAERDRLREDGRVLPPRLLLSIADLHVAMGDFRDAAEIIDYLEFLGTEGDAFRSVMNRYHGRVLGDTSTAAAVREAAGQLDRIATLAGENPGDPGLAATHARLLLLAGRRDEGFAEARGLLDLDGVPPDADLAELARLIAAFDDSLARSLLGLAGDRWRASVDLIEARAQLARMNDGAGAGLAVYDEALKASATETLSSDDSMRVELLRAEYLELQGLGDPVAAWRALSDAYPESALVQTAVLESRRVRDDEVTARSAIARLREAAGEQSLEWRLAALRADLSFLPDDDDERAALLSKTILSLREVRERAPQNPVVHRLMAIAYDSAGEGGEASRAMRGAASLDPIYYPEYVRYLLSRGNRVEAGRAMDAFVAVPFDRLRPETLRERAGLLQTLGRPVDAMADRRVLARSGRLEDLADLGLLFARLGAIDEARSVADELIGPDRPVSAVSAGVTILLEVGLVDRAVESFIDARGDAPSQRLDLARLLIGTGAWEAAETQIREARADASALGADDLGRSLVMLVHTLLERGQWERAGEVLSAADRGDGRARDALARGVSMVNDRADGESGPEGAPPFAPLTRGLAAVRVLERGEENTEESSGMSAVGDALESWLLDEIDLAALRARLRTACEDGPARRTALAWRTLFAAAAADPSMSERVLNDAAEALPQAGWPLELLCESYMSQGRLDDAEKTAALLGARLGTDAFRADVLLARIAATRGRVETSLNWLLPYRDRLVDGAGTVVDRRVLVAGLVRTGRVAEADRLLEQVAESRPGEAGLLALEAFASGGDATDDERRGWLLLADTGLREGVVDPVALGRSWAQLSRETRRGEDASRAIALLGDAGDSASADPIGIGMDLASVEIVLGRTDAAAERYAVLVEQNPESVILRNNYASLLAEAFGEPGHAVEQAREALRLAEAQGAPPSALGIIWHTLGVAQRRAGETAEAEGTLRGTLDRLDAAGALVPDVVIELCEILVERGSIGDAREIVESYDLRGRLSDEQRRRWDAVIGGTE